MKEGERERAYKGQNNEIDGQFYWKFNVRYIQFSDDEVWKMI